MTYPDNVIPFPGAFRKSPPSSSVSSTEPLSSLPADIAPFLTGKPCGPTVKPMERDKTIHQFLTMDGINNLEFGETELYEIEDEAQVLDHYLTALAEQVGAKAVAKLAVVIENYVTSVADISYAQGLTDGSLPEDSGF